MMAQLRSQPARATEKSRHSTSLATFWTCHFWHVSCTLPERRTLHDVVGARTLKTQLRVAERLCKPSRRRQDWRVEIDKTARRFTSICVPSTCTRTDNAVRPWRRDVSVGTTASIAMWAESRR